MFRNAWGASGFLRWIGRKESSSGLVNTIGHWYVRNPRNRCSDFTPKATVSVKPERYYGQYENY
jgi:hypothetical protein